MIKSAYRDSEQVPTHVADTRAKGSLHFLRVRQAGSKDFVESLVQNQGIDIRVDWDGTTSSLGRFEVLVDKDVWQACPNIDIGAMNDLVSPRSIVVAEELWVRVHRGPEHEDCPFQVKAMPVVWSEGREPGATASPQYTAERGVDYEYENGMTLEDVSWTSSASENGMQRIVLSLYKGRTYELRVRLQDPENPGHWLEQDPLVRTDRGGSN